MTSLTPIRPPSSASTRSSTPAAPPNPVFRHQHSLSSSTPGGQHFGALSPHYGGARSAGGPRQSLDASKALATSGPISPRITSGNPLRPNSEMLGVGGQQLFGGPSLEAEAIDKWFEDLQSYEATLEEMAAASLDVNFKEELSAIEQWFRVLSEAERTAALYSLLQSSTQVQIRFFITVLQQMARSDPMTALLSPAPSGGAASMEQQMEAKLAQLSMKSPASPVVRQFARQSLGASINPNNSTESYLSPNSALLNESTGSISGNANNIAANEAAILLANQRAKLKASSANRVSAPGQLLGDSSLKSPKWNNQSGTVEEESGAKTRSPSPRPKSTPGDLNSSGHPNAPHAALARAAAASAGVSGLESQLSPIVGGSWASQVNTPLVPMFANKEEGAGHDPPSARAMDDASTRLAQWGAAHQAGSPSVNTSPAPAQPPNTNNDSSPTSGIQLDDARKFRRQSKGLQGSVSTSTPFSGVLSGLGPSGQNSNHTNAVQSSLSHSLPANSQQPYVGNRNGNSMSNSFGGPRSALHVNNVGGGMPSPITTQSLINAQQAAMAAQQTWRNGLGSPSVPPAPTDQPMVNNMSMMNTLAGLNASININGMANMAAMANMSDPNALQNMANLLNMQQQMQQAQHLHALQQQMQQNGMMGGMLGPNGQIISPLSARLGMSFPAGFPMLGAMPNNKRSPTGRSPVGKPSHTPGSGSNPDEELDMKLLSDIPAWLRGLRLHKYTPNFEGCTWQEMVLMSDSDLDARGVAAVGARRKMLRTFETVRIKKGMALPGDGEMKEEKKESTGGDLEKTTNTTPTPESDKA